MDGTTAHDLEIARLQEQIQEAQAKRYEAEQKRLEARLKIRMIESSGENVRTGGAALSSTYDPSNPLAYVMPPGNGFNIPQDAFLSELNWPQFEPMDGLFLATPTNYESAETAVCTLENGSNTELNQYGLGLDDSTAIQKDNPITIECASSNTTELNTTRYELPASISNSNAEFTPPQRRYRLIQPRQTHNPTDEMNPAASYQSSAVHGYGEYRNAEKSPESGPVRPPSLIQAPRGPPRKANSIPGCCTLDLRPSERRMHRPKSGEEQTKTNLLRKKGACLICRFKKVECDLNSCCANCVRIGWTVLNGIKLGSCLRSFADANPFSAAHELPQHFNGEVSYFRSLLDDSSKASWAIWAILRCSSITSSLPLMTSSPSLTSSLTIIDHLVKQMKKDPRTAKLALAIAEILLVPIWMIKPYYLELELPLTDVPPSVEFTFQHILAFHDMIFSRSNHQSMQTGIDAAQILLEEIGYDRSGTSPLASLELGMRFSFDGPSGTSYVATMPANYYTPVQGRIYSSISTQSTTWDVQDSLTVKNLLNNIPDQQGSDCCHRLLSFPPNTPFEANWTDWLPGWAFSRSTDGEEVEEAKKKWRARFGGGIGGS